jgi:hypothetical protein
VNGDIERRTSGGYSGSNPAGAGPEWAMVGVDVPAGKRLYASRHLKGTAFELAVDAHLNGEGWHLETIMQRMLIITRPTYGECLAELMTIWQNWERNERALAEEGADQTAIRSGR